MVDFDDGPEETSLFGVFDGHGGAEVAEYTAKHLPLWIKKNEFYIKGDLEKALVESFIAFDKSLVEPHVLQILKEMAETPSSDEEDERINEAIVLKEEAEMPIDELLAQYGCQVVKKEEKEDDLPGSSGSSSSSAASDKKPDIPEPAANGNGKEQNGSEESPEEVKKEADEEEGESKVVAQEEKENGRGYECGRNKW